MVNFNGWWDERRTVEFDRRQDRFNMIKQWYWIGYGLSCYPPNLQFQWDNEVGWSIKPYTSGCVPDPLCSSTSQQCSLSEPQPSIAKHSAFWQVEKLDPLHFRGKTQNCHMEPQKMTSSHISAESIWNLIEVKPESSIGSDMSWQFLVIILSLHHWHGCGNLNFTSPSHHHKWITSPIPQW